MYKQGDILLIPIPFTNLTSNKKRPVLVLSKSEYNRKTDDIIVAAITSNINIEDKGYSIFLRTCDLEEGILKVDSVIRADKIYTLSQDIVVKNLGKVNNEIILRVKGRIEALMTDDCSVRLTLKDKTGPDGNGP